MSLASCALALILLVDVSSSISKENLDKQRHGLMDALSHPVVQSVIFDQPGGIALAYIEWETLPTVTVPWTMVQTKSQLNSFVISIEKNAVKETNIQGLTGIGEAVNKAIELFDSPPCIPERMVIDISGDGESNVGAEIELARKFAQDKKIVINGLPLVPEVVMYYQEKVITDTGFIMQIQQNEDFFATIKRKLILEISNWLKLDNDKAL